MRCHPLFSPRQRVRGLDQPAQPVALYMGVDLRRGDIGVAKHLLNATQIGTMIEQMAGEGVPQHMRR